MPYRHVPRRLPLAAPALALCLTVTGCFGKRPTSLVSPLKYRPTSQLNMNSFAGDIPDTTVHVAPVRDARDARDQIGENVEEDKPVAILAGPTPPADFVHDVMSTLLGGTGLKLTGDRAAAERVLVTDLVHFWTREDDTYNGEVRATVTVQDRGGRQLWKGTVNGTAKRFGRSLNPENYQEVFSDAVVNMVQGTLDNPGFRAALKRDAKPAAQ